MIRKKVDDINIVHAEIIFLASKNSHEFELEILNFLAKIIQL
jgi:hypothetical protein